MQKRVLLYNIKRKTFLWLAEFGFKGAATGEITLARVKLRKGKFWRHYGALYHYNDIVAYI